MRARDVMTFNPVSVSPDTTVAEAVEVLSELDIRHLPVVDGETLVGILSDRDLRDIGAPRMLGMEDPDAARARLSVPVVTVMSADVIAVEPDTELSLVMGFMIETKLGAIPVIEGPTRRLVGIVSYIDVLRALQDMLDDD